MDLPESIRQLLWEYDLDADASGESWRDAAVEKVMQRGTWEQMLWLVRSFDRSTLVEFLERRGRRVLSPRPLRFWATMMHIPAETTEEWIAGARVREQTSRG